MWIVIESKELAEALAVINYEVDPDFPMDKGVISEASKKFLIAFIMLRLGMITYLNDDYNLSVRDDAVSMVDKALSHSAYDILYNAVVEKIDLCDSKGCIAFKLKDEVNYGRIIR